MMYGCLFVCRSATNAQKIKKLLERAGIQARIVRPNLQLTGGECGYAVRISDVFLAEALDLLKKSRLTPNKIYVSDTTGRYREMKP